MDVLPQRRAIARFWIVAGLNLDCGWAGASSPRPVGPPFRVTGGRASWSNACRQIDVPAGTANTTGSPAVATIAVAANADTDTTHPDRNAGR